VSVELGSAIRRSAWRARSEEEECPELTSPGVGSSERAVFLVVPVGALFCHSSSEFKIII
jgi:hypothetical protein